MFLQSFVGVDPRAVVFAGNMQPRGGLQCNPQRPHDPDDDPRGIALPQLQGGNRQWHTPCADAEFHVCEYNCH